ncbi:glycerophosphodiester phosphodiesterase family protein [Neobacillus terrae]|uniref:glycerophosphodiester phosphodiesterase family protein n=1 Tax=Neobacillus terrae TaxID=3034837 RepID=UPI00140AFD42|nr:glycerophosphodiester phosphodiesterase family protein [Neobacillus terrae]NHM33571.1 glycerophosphodiester phosphodiesterase [Neobacillus terrae]
MKKKKLIVAAMAALMAGSAAIQVAVTPASAAETAPKSYTAGSPKEFDLQAHRGGIGLTVESTIASFSKGLEVGVSTLEMDVQITKDHQAVITHDRQVSGSKCQDTGPAFPGDPMYPYVGKYIKDLTLAEVRTLDCGSLRQASFPGQQLNPGARMPLLSEVFNLVKLYHANKVHMNVETKVEAGAPNETAPREEFVQIVAHEVRKAGMINRVTIESFDWGSLMRMHQVEPRLPLVALTNGDQFLQPGKPGASPWLGGIDIDDFGGDFVAAAHSLGASAISPVHGDPQGGKVTDPNYKPYVTKQMVEEAHKYGMKVIPWTVDDEPTMEKLMDDGVDGMITDYPDLLRSVMKKRGYKLPKAYLAPKK